MQSFRDAIQIGFGKVKVLGSGEDIILRRGNCLQTPPELLQQGTHVCKGEDFVGIFVIWSDVLSKINIEGGKGRDVVTEVRWRDLGTEVDLGGVGFFARERHPSLVESSYHSGHLEHGKHVFFLEMARCKIIDGEGEGSTSNVDPEQVHVGVPVKGGFLQISTNSTWLVNIIQFVHNAEPTGSVTHVVFHRAGQLHRRGGAEMSRRESIKEIRKRRYKDLNAVTIQLCPEQLVHTNIKVLKTLKIRRRGGHRNTKRVFRELAL